MMNGLKEDEARLIVLERKEEPAYYMTIEEDKEKNGEGKIVFKHPTIAQKWNILGVYRQE